MSNFLICLHAVFPVFAILCIGYIARLCNIIRHDDVGKMNRVAFHVFMPLLLFNNVYHSDLSAALKPKLILYTVVCIFLVATISTLFTLRFFSDKKQKGVIIQGLFRSNFVAIGLPIASSLVGGDVSAVSVLIAVVVPLFNALSVIVLESFNGQGVSWKKIPLEIVKNPLIQGSAIGVLCLILDIRLPPIIESLIQEMSDAATPLIVFLLGAFFSLDSLKKQSRPLVAVTLGRLIVVPGLCLTGGYLIGLRNVEFVALIGAFASSAAAGSFAMAQQMGGDAELAGNIIIVTSALCSFTIFGWSLLFKYLGAF